MSRGGALGRAGGGEAVRELRVAADDRLLLVAPHPDDEALGGGGLLARAAAAGAAVTVLFLTDGENNPWAQRVSELRIVIGEPARRRFGARRRREAEDSMRSLGLSPDRGRFLGLPDQGLTNLFLSDPVGALGRVRKALADAVPTLVVGPSVADLHPDHSAAALLIHLAASPTPRHPGVSVLTYLIHNPALRRAGGSAVRLSLAPAELERKRAAIRCHRTQRILRGPWMERFGGPEERFSVPSADLRAPHPVVAAVGEGELRLEIDSRRRVGAFGRRTVLLAVATREGACAVLAFSLPEAPGSVRAVELRTGEAVATGEWRGRAGRGTLALPAGLIPTGAEAYAKVEHRFGFFDEAGWRQLPSDRETLPPLSRA